MDKKIYYPAIFHPEETGYSVSVPDLDGCFTQGDTIDEALEMTKEAIGLYLDGENTYPNPSAPEALKTENGDFIMFIKFDSLEYSKKHNKDL